MAIQLEFINLIVPMQRICDVYPGGWDGCQRDHANSIGRVVWYDDRLFRTGAMDPEVMDNLIEKWTRLEFDATEVVDGKVVWKDFCVITAYGQSEHLCPWIEVHPAGRAARHRGTELWKVKGRENL